MKKIGLTLLFLTASMWAQIVPHCDNVFGTKGGYLKPLAGAKIYICSASAAKTVPCSPTVTLYKSLTDSTVVSNPVSSDSQGGYCYYADAGVVMEQITASGYTTSYRYVALGSASGSSSYVLTAATSYTLGGVKGTGSGLTCPNGRIANGFYADGALSCVAVATVTVLTSGCTSPATHCILVAWTNGGSPSSNTVYRATTTGGPYSAVSTVAPAANSWLDNSVSSGTIYYYVVTETVSGTESSYSMEASALVP